MTSALNPAVERWENAKRSLLADVGMRSPVHVHIPGWQPVSLEEGLQWLQASLFEAFRVDWKLTETGDAGELWMRIWEPDEAAPDWGSIHPSLGA